MSRIAGIFLNQEGKREARSFLTTMLQGLQRSSQWPMVSLSSQGTWLGWCGWRSPNVAERDHLLAVVDGVFYNRSELGEGSTDAERVCSLYLRYGFEGVLEKINGDFAIALYDSKRDTLWLARDRFGIKPLYYAAHSRGFAFASQPRALLALPDLSWEVNRQFVSLFAASHYRYFDNRPEESPYTGIAQLPPAHFLRVTRDGVEKRSYWSLQDLPDFTESEAELAERYRTLLGEAVSLRFTSARRSAFTLSGGMDSSSILASSVRLTGKRQHAFSVVYADKTYDESKEIQPMLKETVEAWHPVSVEAPDLFGLVERMVDLHDEPVATATWLSHFLLCEQTVREGFGALFGGLGGDELNAGEYEHFLYHFADLRHAGDENRLAHEVRLWIRYHDHPVFRKTVGGMEEALARLVDFSRPGRCLPDRERLGRYGSALNRDYFDLQAFEPVMEHPFKSYLKNRTFQDLTRETIPCCLRAEDRQTTAFGLDHFLPFFDHRLVEFMFRVPGTLKFRDGIAKVLLREGMRGILPEETRTRVKKTGWNAPSDSWFRGAAREPLLDLIESRSFCEMGVYDQAETRRLADEHLRGEANHMMFLWQVVNLSLWWQGLKRRREEGAASRLSTESRVEVRP